MADEKTDTKGSTAVTDAPVAPQIIVQMVQPTAGEPTEGLSTTQSGGSYVIHEIETEGANAGKQVKRTVDAEGQPIKK